MGRPFVAIVIAYVAGLLLAQFIPLPGTGLTWLFAVAAALLLPALLFSRARPFLIWPLLALAGWINFAAHTQNLSPYDLRGLLSSEPALVTIRGNLTETPRLKIHLQDGGETWHGVTRVNVSALLRDGQWQPALGTVLASTPGLPDPQLFTGQPVEISGVIAPPPGPVAEGLFDYRTFLQNRGVFFLLKTSAWSDWKLLDPHLGRPPLSDRFLTCSRQTLALGLPAEDETLRLLWAMTLDWRTAFTGDISDPFLQAGTMHMFAIDGLRIALVAGIIVTLLRALRLSRAWCGLVAVPIIWFYTAATGWESSAVRASTMMTIILGGWALKRPTDLLNSLAAAAFIILVWNPRQMFEAGFQLSFCVVLVIALMLPPLNDFCDRLLRPDPLLPESLLPEWKRALLKNLRKLAHFVALSFTAWIGSLPLSAKFFHLFSPVSTLANLFAVPLGTLALMANLGSLICGHWLVGATVLFNHAAWGCMTAMTWVSAESAKIPGAYFYVPEPSLFTIVLYYAVIIALCSGWLITVRRRWTGLATLLCIGAVYLGSWLLSRAETDITVLGLNGGQVVYVDAPGRHHDWLVNCGNDEAIDFTLKPFLRAQGVNWIPRLVLTAGNGENVGGAPALDDLFGVGELWTSQVKFRSSYYREATEYYDSPPARHHFLNFGETQDCWQVLHPKTWANSARAEDNPLVLRGNFHGTKILLLSDLSRSGQDDLLSRTNDLHADIVVSGLPTSSEPLCDELIQAIAPKLIIITDADYPVSSHAHEPLKDRLEASGIPTLYTRTAGAIKIITTDTGWKIKTMDGQIFNSR